MPTNYPGSLDALTNPLATDSMASPSHAAQHANANDAIEAIQATLGTNPQGAESTVSARIAALEGGGGGGGVAVSQATTVFDTTNVSAPDATYVAFTGGFGAAAGRTLMTTFDLSLSVSASSTGAAYLPRITQEVMWFDVDLEQYTQLKIETVSLDVPRTGSYRSNTQHTILWSTVSAGTYAVFLMIDLSNAPASQVSTSRQRLVGATLVL